MDPRNNVRTAATAPAPAAQPVNPAQAVSQHVSHIKPSLVGNILIVLLIVLAALGIGFFGLRAFGAASVGSAIKAKQYQALFLTNGQVYFGKIDNVDASYVKLSDIYYLQVQQQVQPDPKKDEAQPQISLAKLGGELHGPEDTMQISRSQVLFWENLKEDGKVVKAIREYQATQKK